MRTLQSEADLLIAGAGPSGLALAAELARRGINSRPNLFSRNSASLPIACSRCTG